MLPGWLSCLVVSCLAGRGMMCVSGWLSAFFAVSERGERADMLNERC